MATFILIPGAGGMAWYWHRVIPLLARGQHEAIAVDLPADDKHAGLDAYVDIVLCTIGMRRDVILVAQSLGGFIAPLVATRTTVESIVFVNAMIPEPGETAGAWFGNTGATDARVKAAERGGYSTVFDVATYFLHDVPQSVLRDGPGEPPEEAEIVFMQPCHFESWPQVRIYVVAGIDDRFFPLAFQRQVAKTRLDLETAALPGGHLIALSQPEALVEWLLARAG